SKGHRASGAGTAESIIEEWKQKSPRAMSHEEIFIAAVRDNNTNLRLKNSIFFNRYPQGTRDTPASQATAEPTARLTSHAEPVKIR
ncbi:MAG: hypothetical protein IKZ66_00880, partial [Schwartzia sp.]|nr:hypothetical protein [Schwartzia sp. (in: firmicutes)]